MTFQVDPKEQTLFLGVLAGVSFLSALSPSVFPHYLSAEAANITQTAGIIAGFMAAVGASLGLVSSSKPGPFAPQDPPAVRSAELQIEKAKLEQQIADLAKPF